MKRFSRVRSRSLTILRMFRITMNVDAKGARRASHLPRFILRFNKAAVTSLVLFFSLAFPIGGLMLLPAQAGEWWRQEITTLRQSGKHWIEINRTTQRLVAWEGNTPVYAVVVSTGMSHHPTRVGSFKVQLKYRTARMRGDDYDISDVPYTMYYDGSYAIHGAYWHHRFGTPVSHGCVNVAVNHARWLFNWAAIGTPVLVHD